jgi:putative ABC transport system permease protein
MTKEMKPMFLQDLRITARHLSKSPGFSATAVLMLTLGIGATTAIFSIVEAVLLRPLPFPNPERLVSISDVLQDAKTSNDGGDNGVTSVDILNYSRDTHAFESSGGYQQVAFELSGAGEPAQINAARLSTGALDALAVQPMLGRFFTKQEDDQHEPVTLISYGFWQTRLQGNPNVLGTKLLLDRKPYLVIGVMPRNFEFPLLPGRLNNAELWVPMSFTSEEMGAGQQANWDFRMIGRLKPGISYARAQQDAERVAQETMRGYPAFMASLHIRASVHSLREETVYDARDLLRMLFLAILVVLLIACANLAGLLLVRAIRRRREIAMRLALGASSLRLLRQSVLESLLLSVTGGALGLVLAALGLRIGVSYLPETLPRIDEIGLDWRVVLFAVGLSLLTGLGCGLVPAFAALKTNVNDTLKEGGRSGSSTGHAWMRSGLVAGEIATALVLLAAAGLLLRSFEKMRNVDLGFHPDHVLVACYSLPKQRYPNQTAVNGFNRELISHLRQLPGVKFAGFTEYLPALSDANNSTFVVEGYAPPKGARMNLATYILTEGDYLQSMGIPLLKGRFFADSDNGSSPLVAIVNRKFAEHYWHDADPIGKRFRIGTPESRTEWLTVVGEVADVKEYSPDSPDKEEWYQPVEQFGRSLAALGSDYNLNGNAGFIALRTAEPPEQMATSLRATVRSIDSQLPLSQLQTMQRAVSDSETPRRFQTTLISAFAASALFLAILGIYSVIAFSAALRVQEMAVRMALGSQRSGILRLVLLSATKLALLGCVLGLLGAAATSRLIDSLLFEVSPLDPLVLSLSAAFVMTLAIVASLLPAQRAASVDPVQALRAE